MTVLEARPAPPTAPPVDEPRADAGPAPRQRPRRHRLRRRRRRIALLVVTALMLPVGWSYTSYLTAAGDAPVGVRSVDWLRDHGFESIVNSIEQWWYTRTKPTGSKVPTSELPNVLRPKAFESAASTSSGPTTQPPSTIPPLVSPPQAGEGVWQPVDGLAVPSSAVEQTFLRPDRRFPSVGAILVRIDQAATGLVYVPGTVQPGGGPWSWGSQIPAGQRQRVIAAFNAGFKFKHTKGGVYTEGRTAVRPLQDGLAAIVIGKDGTADVAKWGRDATMGPNVASVRQNLDLIVDHGKAVDGLVTDRGGRWGTVKSQLQFTWRSGLGVDSRGRLIYAAGPKMTLTQLATTLARAGSVRAMQLDIHDNVVTFNWYRPVAGTRTDVTGARLTPAMTRDATRYLDPDQRDFFAVVAR